MTTHHECKCGFEIEMNVDSGEGTVDLLEECPECNYVFSKLEQHKIYQQALEDAWSSAIDYATDRMEDR